MTQLFRRFTLVCSVMLLAACTSYQYIPPSSDAGRHCVVSCDTNRQICIAGKEQAAASQNQICENRRTMQLSNCLMGARTREARAYCEKVTPSCHSSHASTGTCESSYRACYVQCGGQVLEVKD